MRDETFGAKPEAKFLISVKEKLSGAEEELTAWLLSRVNSDNIPRKIFDAIFGTVPGTALEVVPLYVDDDGQINVFLTKRDSKDKYWPDEMHCPGTMILNKDDAKDGSFENAWKRLQKTEFMERKLSDPIPVEVKMLDTKRGKETALIHYVMVPGNLTNGEYFPVDKLPKNTIDHHIGMIRDAAYDLVGESRRGRLNLPVSPKIPESWQGIEKNE